MPGKPHITRGIPISGGTDGPVPIRREMRDLERNYPDQWNLYLLALSEFQAIDENEQLSYYQVAVLHTFIKSQADSFLEKDGEARYQKAAQDFRMPYWDWTLEPLNGENYLPASLGNKDINVIKPGSQGKPGPMKNPLYEYNFKTLQPWDGDSDPLVRKWNSTVRWPKPGTSVSQNDLLEGAIRNEVANLREKTFLLVASYEKYGPFSNQKWNLDTAAIYNSLEDVHNTMHTRLGGEVTGGNGHMSRIPYSAFDPVFWLHHTNIDRLFAIWQALHPDDSKHVERYVTTQTNRGGTFITKPNGEETIKTPLAPFGASAENYWTSEEVKQTSSFGYVYPETQKWNFKTDKEYRAAIVKALRALNPSISLALILAGDAQSQKTAVSKIEKASTFWQDYTKKHGMPAYRDINTLAPNKKYLEWITNIKAQKHAVGGAFNVHIFLGDFTSSNSKRWPFDANHVGTFTVLGDSDDTGCEKCQTDQAANLQVTGQVPLTIALLERFLAGIVPSLSEDAIVPYLKEKLHWRVTLGDGSERPRGDVDDLTVSVISNEVTVPATVEELPKYAAGVEVYPAVTTKESGVGGRGDGTGLTQSGFEQGGNTLRISPGSLDNELPTMAQEPPLDEIQWRSPKAQEMGGIHTNTVLPYFAESPFFDATSNNATLTTQALYNPNMYYIIQTREAFEGRLRTMQGLEFMVVHDPSENDTKRDHNGVWVVRKQNRRKRQGAQDEVTGISSYYVVGENVYMAPSVGNILGSRLLSTVTSLTKLLSTASSLPSFTPSLGHTYLPPVTKNPTPGSSLQATQASKEGTPMPGGGTPLPATQETVTSVKASKAASDMGLQGIHMLAYSYELSDRYANEYMDENPIVGEPGSFKLSKSHNTSLASSMTTSKTSSQTQEVSKPSSQSLDVASPAKSAVPTPQLKTEDLPAPIRKATKGSEKSPITPGTKDKKSRRKSKAAGDKGATTPKATTPKPATPA
ncbi:MAG: hypothetical protein ASARMPRED_008848 [Alectoria sarmentosa]|nr:MAG: hypothetical protein ASARMPRED_008848 [Alectoria sarmentosa]